MPHRRYRFDGFELHPHDRVLYRDGLPTTLGARAVDVLSVLVGAGGRLVSKIELLNRVWPGLVVEENNLQVQISTLRKHLGSGAIATVPGRGYRFCLTVDASGDEPVTPRARPGPGPASSVLLMPLASGRLSPPPAPAGALWGRDADLAAIQAMAASALITVVGQPGVGKSALCQALAQQALQARPGAVAWVDLSGLADPQLLVSAVARATGVAVGGQGPASGDAEQGLGQALAHSDLLLVLDNAEHLHAAVTRVVQVLMRTAPGLRLLVTSQMPLKVPGERLHRLQPLALPALDEDVGVAARRGAVALFVDQILAQRGGQPPDDADMARIVRICRRLDGVPLALKLAAARVAVLGLQGVEERLDARFQLLQSRAAIAPQRQQALLAALDWSHDLLAPAEQAVFRRLAVVAGSCAIDFAQRLNQDLDLDEWTVIDVLGTLVERSFVTLEAGAFPRYRLLDSMRDYARLKLEAAGELATLRRRHAEAMADACDRAYEAYWHEPDAPWLAQHGADLDNIRVALDWCCGRDEDLGVRLAGGAAPLLLLQGLAPEARQRMAPLVSAATVMPPSSALGRFWLELARFHWGLDMAATLTMARRAWDIAHQAADRRACFMALRAIAGCGRLPVADAWAALHDMASLDDPAWPVRLRTQRHLAEVGVLMASQRMGDARRACQSLLVLAQSAGLDGLALAAMRELAAISMTMGDLDAALENCQALLANARFRRDPFVLHAQAMVACIHIVRGDLAAARHLTTDFVHTSAARGWDWLGWYAPLLALLAALEGRLEAAARLLGHARAQPQGGMGDVLTVYAVSRASSLLDDALPQAERALLEQAGRDMPCASVAAWALGHALPLPPKPS